MIGIHKLTALQVAKAARQRATVGDGGGLQLQRGTAWVQRYERNGRTRYMGLGALAEVDLASVRVKSAEVRQMLAEGKDPLDVKATSKARAKVGSANTFAQAARAFLADNDIKWDNPKHVGQWFIRHLARRHPPDRQRLLQAAARRGAGRHRYAAGAGGAQADLVHQAGDRVAPARPHRARHRLGHGARSAP